ncbi:hypothetical protein E8E14_006853 [Neopestalotiopsis sp. 37M]|nr:hypothetical protein E8E14_006853 [Neopestalotiopsis sp. 37M]
MTQLQRPSPGERGLQKIHILSLTGDWAGVQKLLSDKRTTEARTTEGMTPLMLAALFGHVEVVGVLRQHHASLEAVDKFGHSSLVYTLESGFNTTRRQSFSHYFAEQNPEAASLRRLVIAPMLSLHKPEAKPYTANALGPEYIRICSNGIEAYRSLGSIHTPRSPKPDSASGYINSPNDLSPRAWAVPGWFKAYPHHQSSALLDGETFTKAALLRVAPAIGFSFKPHLLDQGWSSGKLTEAKRGRWFASHVECKLAVWHCTTILASVKSMPEASMTFLARHLSDLRDANIGDARHMHINITLPPCESCATFLQALTQITGITFEVKYRRSVALIPETFKTRNFKLAYEANLDKPAEDNGSDAGWDDDTEENERMEPSMFSGGHATESEEILEGIEEYEILGPRFRPNVAEDDVSGRSDGDEENEEEEVIVEDYRDDAIDGTYPGLLPRQPERDLAASITSCPRPDPATPGSEPSSPDLIVGTPISSEAPSPLPRISLGSEEDPIEVPTSPSEMANARRQQKNSDVPKWSHQYNLKKLDAQRRASKIKRETQEGSLSVIPKRQKTDNTIGTAKPSIPQPVSCSQARSTKLSEKATKSVPEKNRMSALFEESGTRPSTVPTCQQSFSSGHAKSTKLKDQATETRAEKTTSLSEDMAALHDHLDNLDLSITAAYALRQMRIREPPGTTNAPASVPLNASMSFTALLETFRRTTPERALPDTQEESPFSDCYFAPPDSP